LFEFDLKLLEMNLSCAFSGTAREKEEKATAIATPEKCGDQDGDVEGFEAGNESVDGRLATAATPCPQQGGAIEIVQRCRIGNFC
jgi:hypothetical protein